MKYKILISAPYLLPVIDNYHDLFIENDCELIKANVIERLCENELLSLMHDIEFI